MKNNDPGWKGSNFEEVICAGGRHQIKVNMVHVKTIMAVRERFTAWFEYIETKYRKIINIAKKPDIKLKNAKFLNTKLSKDSKKNKPR